MTQRRTQEPSKIVMLAPVALVLIIYSFFVHIPQQAELQSRQSRYEKLLSEQHDNEHALQDVQFSKSRIGKQLRETDLQLKDLRSEERELLATREQLRNQALQPSWPAATMQRVTSLMEGHNLEVLENQTEADARGQAKKVIQPLLTLLGTPEQNQSSKPDNFDGREIYMIKVRGEFQNLQAALNSLSKQLDHVLPLSLQMEVLELESQEIRQPERVWTLKILV